MYETNKALVYLLWMSKGGEIDDLHSHKGIIFLSIVLGFGMYELLLQIFCFFMSITMGCNSLGNHDFQFLLDEKDNNHLIVGAGVFEKFDYISFKQHLINKTQYINRCRSKLVKMFGLYWFKEMGEDEWKEHIHKVVTL